MRFQHPEALLLLLLIPVLMLVLRRRNARRAVGFPTSAELARLRPSFAARLHAALPWLRALVLGLAVLALAGPQWGVETTRILREGIAIAMVIDRSSSMSAIDLRLEDRPSNRLEVVKATFREFVTGGDAGVEGRGSDAIGMVTFARYADTISPPTLDHEALLGLLDQVGIVELPPEDGTAIGDAIVRAIDMLGQADGASKVMILLTDGSYNAGEVEPLVAAQVAGAYGIKIYTIGAGTQGTALMPVAAPDGGTDYLPSEVSIDEATLTQIAQLTDGKYFRATDAEALRSIYAEIDRLEKAQNVAEHHQRYIEIYPLIIALGLALLLLESALVTTRLRAIP
ncbi:MAG TPA: VWA domain-containing protein [Geminicoccaceae bacterium]